MTPTLPRRSFLGWTAALAGATLLTRPALAVPQFMGWRFYPLPSDVVSWSAVDMLADGLMYDYAMPEAKAREIALRMVGR